MNFGRTLRRRWGDNDRYFGPFTFAFRERWRHFAVLLSSGDDEYPGCNLRVSAFGNTMIIGLPKLLRPYVGWHDLSHADWAKPGPDGRKGYVEVDEREYGFLLSDGHLSVKLGRQTNDSSTTQDWGCFLPWTQWRTVAERLFDDKGELWATKAPRIKGERNHDAWSRWYELRKACPAVRFSFADYDGEQGFVTTYIEEHDSRLGTGWFKWLGLFKRRSYRGLDIAFSIEVGERKGSWKGGTLGHSIRMHPGELHESAFRRYCSQHRMTFIGPA
jgi:hypothetical protein